MDLSLDILAIISAILVALITAIFKRRAGLDVIIHKQLKLLIEQKEKEIDILKRENDTLQKIIEAQDQKIQNGKTNT